MKILVTGATGYIGGRLIPRLLEKGYSVRCLARQRENLAGRAWNTPDRPVEVFAGDVLNESSLVNALKGCDIAYYLVHSMSAGEKLFEHRDRKAAFNFARATKSAGTKRIIYLGGLGEAEDPKGLSNHLKSRQEVGSILGTSGVPVTEFRAAIIVGSGSVSFEMIRYLTERLPIIVCPKWVYSRCQPISIRDVLNYLISAIGEEKSAGRIMEIGGRNVLTYADMIMGYAKVRKLRRILLPLPVLSPRLSARWIDLITPIPDAFARPLIEGMKNDVVCRNDDAKRIFGFELLSYEEAVVLALERIQQGEVQTIWSGAQSSLLSRPDPMPSLKIQEGMILEKREALIEAPPSRVFGVFSKLGGEQGWLYADWIWKLRAIIDRICGGIGMRRGRRSWTTLCVGDPIDFGRVEEIVEDRILRLRMEMKVPGKAWLQFEVKPVEGNKSFLIQTAFFEPKGLLGHLYWHILYPIHRLIFSGLCREIKLHSLKR